MPSPSSYWFVWEYCGELRSVFEKEKKDVYMLLVGSLLITKRKKRAMPIYPHPQTDVDTQRCNFWVPCNMFASLSYLSKYIFLYRHVDACTIFVFECAIPVQFRFFFLSFQSLCFSASFRCCSTWLVLTLQSLLRLDRSKMHVKLDGSYLPRNLALLAFYSFPLVVQLSPETGKEKLQLNCLRIS